jgi:hypothetical protein
MLHQGTFMSKILGTGAKLYDLVLLKYRIFLGLKSFKAVWEVTLPYAFYSA